MNPEYTYGWAVPVLCGYLAFARKAEKRKSGNLEIGGRRSEVGGRVENEVIGKGGDLEMGGRRSAVGGRVENLEKRKSGKAEIEVASGGLENAEMREDRDLEMGGRRSAVGGRVGNEEIESEIKDRIADRRPPTADLQFAALFWLGVLGILYLPTRVIQEANPGWGFASWPLALEVVGITLILLYLAGGRPWLRSFAFPVCFFLVAVPWPWGMREMVVQALTRFNIAVGVETLGFLNIPALQKGNVIEIATGLVGIEEACSGIRSFQSTLMIGLFFGELHRFNLARRIYLVAAGIGLAFVLNVVRTVILVSVASRDGLDAIHRWHDPVGVPILVGCFLGVWLFANWEKRKSGKAEIGVAFGGVDNGEMRDGGDLERGGRRSEVGPEKSEIWKSGKAEIGVAFGGVDNGEMREGGDLEMGGRRSEGGGRVEDSAENAEKRKSGKAEMEVAFGGLDTNPKSKIQNPKLDESLSPATEPEDRRTVALTHRRTVPPTHRPTDPPSHRRTVAPSHRPTVPLAMAVATWMLACEGINEAWYRVHAAKLPPAIEWAATVPKSGRGLEEVKMPAESVKMLAFDSGKSVRWLDADGHRWQMFYFRWLPTRPQREVELAMSHRPEICLPASGYTMKSDVGLEPITIGGVPLPFRSYVFEQSGELVHVFRCVVEDGWRRPDPGRDFSNSGRWERLQAAWEGRRQTGARVLELGVWGCRDLADANRAFRKMLLEIVRF